jgi:hypothetical protein
MDKCKCEATLGVPVVFGLLVVRDHCGQHQKHQKQLLKLVGVKISSCDSIDFVQAYGYMEIIAKRRLMMENTLFDLASVTKVTAMWPSIVRLLDERRIKLENTLDSMLDISNLPADIGGITLHQSPHAGLELSGQPWLAIRRQLPGDG